MKKLIIYLLLIAILLTLGIMGGCTIRNRSYVRKLIAAMANDDEEEFDKLLKKVSRYNINSYDSGWVSPGVTEPTLNPTSAFRELTGKGIKDGDPEWEAEELKWKPLVEHLDNPTAAGFSTTGSFPDTPEKIRGAFYWAFVHGSNGFYYWLFTNPKDSLNLRWGWYTLFYQPRLCSAVRSTLSEIRELSGFLINPLAGSTSYKNPENPGLFVWSKSYGGKRIVIVVNETGQELSGASVDLRPLGLEAQTAAVFKEDGRKILIDGGIMKDSFRTDEAHVYFVE